MGEHKLPHPVVKISCQHQTSPRTFPLLGILVWQHRNTSRRPGRKPEPGFPADRYRPRKVVDYSYFIYRTTEESNNTK